MAQERDRDTWTRETCATRWGTGEKGPPYDSTGKKGPPYDSTGAGLLCTTRRPGESEAPATGHASCITLAAGHAIVIRPARGKGTRDAGRRESEAPATSTRLMDTPHGIHWHCVNECTGTGQRNGPETPASRERGTGAAPRNWGSKDG